MGLRFRRIDLRTTVGGRITAAMLVTATVLGAKADSAPAALIVAGPEVVAPTPAAPYVVTLAGSGDESAAVRARLEHGIGFVSSATYTHSLRGFAATLTTAQVAEIRKDRRVTSVVPDLEIRASGAKGSTAPQPEVLPAGVKRIGADGRGPANSAVAVLDTGLDLANPDLNAVHGVNCVKPSKPAQDHDGHGTHVGGTIAARADGAAAIGVAPNTRLYSVKVLSSGGKGRLSGLLCGIDWVRANARRLDIRVANVSITASGYDDGACGARTGDPLHAAICDSVAAGILYVAAAGNAAVDLAHTVPATYSEVLTVSAATDTDGLPGGTGAPACDERDDTAASYSNFATTDADAAHLLAAPGTCVTSSKLGGGVESMQGTSMAAPHVAGAAALCLGSAGVPGPCASLRAPSEVIQQLRDDAAERAAEGFGFAGDPLQPFADRRTGHLVSAVDY